MPKTKQDSQLDLGLFDSQEAQLDSEKSSTETSSPVDAINEKLVHRSPVALALALEHKQAEVESLDRRVSALENDSKSSTGIETHSWITIIVFLVTGLIAIYALSVNYFTNTKIDRQYDRVIKQIRDAYSGDPSAHAEIIARIPELTRRRLPRTLSTGDNESFMAVQGPSEIIDDSLQVSARSKSDDLADTPDLGVVLEVGVYSQPLESSVLLGFLTDDADVIRVIETAENPGWLQLILSRGFPSWLSSDFLEDDGTGQLRVSGSSVNLRADPSLGSNTIGRLQKGTLVDLMSTQDQWSQIRTPAIIKLWVKQSDFQRFTEAPFQMNDDGPQISATPEQTTETVTPEANSVDGVGVYSQASTSSVLLGFLTNDADVIRVIESSANPGWVQVMLSRGFPSWVSSDFLEDDGTDLLRVIGANVNLRADRSLGSNVIGRLQRGTLVNVMSRQGDWIQIRTPANFRLWVKGTDFQTLSQ